MCKFSDNLETLWLFLIIRWYKHVLFVLWNCIWPALNEWCKNFLDQDEEKKKYLNWKFVSVFQFISNENAKKKLGDVDGLTEEKVDEVVEEFLEDVKENLIEDKGWLSNKFSAYSVSKTVLNAYTRVLANKYPTVAINAVSPGFTKTDLNYNAGVLTTEEAAKGPVMLALMPDSKPSGLFFDKTLVSTFWLQNIMQ